MIKWIVNGKLVLKDRLVNGKIRIEHCRIAEIITDEPGGDPSAVNDWGGSPDGEHIIDAAGMYVLPGIIDMHSDAIEKEISPRPNARFPFHIAFAELEKKLAGNGITTIYHSLALMGVLGNGMNRDNESIFKLVNELQEQSNAQSMVRHRLHLRYELTNLSALDMIKKLIGKGRIQLLSYMDHAPGQGQFRTNEEYERYFMKTYGISEEAVKAMAQELAELQRMVDWNALSELATFARSKGVRVASHDDDSLLKIDTIVRCGISISEFPVDLETAIYARKCGLSVLVGAPNIVRGLSHSNNLRAVDAIEAGAANILCSDYHPASMLHAVFKLEAQGIPLPEAVRFVTLHPAQALGIDDQFGSLEPGKQADLIFVHSAPYPAVRETIVAGQSVYRSGYAQDQFALLQRSSL